MARAFITGLSGLVLAADEARFLADSRPAGLILFARNCDNPEQIRRLVAESRVAVGERDTLVLIDQEGGRVQRLRPPHWRALPSAAAFGAMLADDRLGAGAAATAAARLVAEELVALGINMNCAPVLDLPVAGAHDIIGNRAYGRDVTSIVALGRVVAEGLMAGGVVPVVKHIPGHGRATADSHMALPVVDTPREELETTDFAPFRALADMPAAMTAHVVYTAIDASAPASTSSRVTADVIRGRIGFDGLLMSDDVGMKALSGPFDARARAVIAAGSDLALHCSGDMAEMIAVAAGVPALAGKALDRFERAMAITRSAVAFDRVAAENQLAAVLQRMA